MLGRWRHGVLGLGCLWRKALRLGVRPEFGRHVSSQRNVSRVLAESIYTPPNRERIMRLGNSNVYLFTGLVESYRIYAYHTQSECETALTGLTLRQRR